MAAVQQNTTYARELLAGDLVAITSEVLEIGERKIQFPHTMVECLTGDIASICQITGVHIDRKMRRSTAFLDYIRTKALELAGDLAEWKRPTPFPTWQLSLTLRRGPSGSMRISGLLLRCVKGPVACSGRAIVRG